MFLDCGASFQVAEVKVNGKTAGRHEGGYTAFRSDLTPFLKPGENWVEVRVDNRWSPRIAPRAGEHTFSGGLYRNVHLHVCSPVYLLEDEADQPQEEADKKDEEEDKAGGDDEKKKSAEEAKKKVRVDGTLLLSADKKRYSRGDAVKVSVKGRNLRLVNALSFALPYDPKDLEFVGVEVKNMKNMENLTNDRLHTNGTKALYPTFVNIGDKEPVEGTSELFVLKFKARRDMKFQPKLTDGMVVDKKLNTKKL